MILTMLLSLATAATQATLNVDVYPAAIYANQVRLISTSRRLVGPATAIQDRSQMFLVRITDADHSDTVAFAALTLGGSGSVGAYRQTEIHCDLDARGSAGLPMVAPAFLPQPVSLAQCLFNQLNARISQHSTEGSTRIWNAHKELKILQQNPLTLLPHELHIPAHVPAVLNEYEWDLSIGPSSGDWTYVWSDIASTTAETAGTPSLRQFRRTLILSCDRSTTMNPGLRDQISDALLPDGPINFRGCPNP